MSQAMCFAYRENGAICRKPARNLDRQSGGMVCDEHFSPEIETNNEAALLQERDREQGDGIRYAADTIIKLRIELRECMRMLDAVIAVDDADAGAACWKALNRLLREIEWRCDGGRYFVTRRDSAVPAIAAILEEAEAAHSAWVHAHGG
jgi:hypothetical protein